MPSSKPKREHTVAELRAHAEDSALLASLGMDDHERAAVREAAADAHMTARTYCRLMVLAAAGMGGACEHLDRAISASFDASTLPGYRVLVATPKRRDAVKSRRKR